MPFIHSQGLTLHVHSSGPATAPTLVLINPIGSDLRVWDAVARTLSPRFHVLQYDLRGQGLSDAPSGEYTLDDHVRDLQDLLDAHGVAHAALAGCSLGGLVAQGFALAHPARVTRLALLDTLPRIGSETSWTQRADQVRARGLPALAPDLVQRWFAPTYFQRCPTEAHGYTTLLARTPQPGYLGSCAALRDADLRGAITDLTSPTLVLCGEQDVSTPPQACQAFAEQIGAAFDVVPGAAHLPMVEQPHVVAERLGRFLQPSLEPPDDRYQRGLSVRRQVLGAAHVDRATAAASDLDRDFQTFITEYAWGGPWSRGHLDVRTRHLLTLAVLTALPREHELELHIRATRNTGVTPDDLQEVFLHVAVYAGVPVANRALQIAKRVLGEEP
ncbi:3-oxoadipate enol-lactonase [Deinococcus sonorensis]|uniref:3-oxoadipate enol-lactonase n=2 Tax=Deinococcus sonorensis TaxID=309891 RepID=A0AAU7U6A9_9DEIO